MSTVVLAIEPGLARDRMAWVALHVRAGYQVDLVFSSARWAAFAREALGRTPPDVAVSQENNVLHVMPVAPRRRRGRKR